MRQYVGLSLFLDFENFTHRAPRPQMAGYLDTLLDEVILWGRARRGVRAERGAAA